MNRGRVYECNICSYKGERKSAAKHFKAKHISAIQRQFHCTLCNFSTDDKALMERHPGFYKPHSLQKEVMLAAGTYLGDDTSYTSENPNPRLFDEETDLRRWEAAESAIYWESKRKPFSMPPSSVSLPTTLVSTLSSAIPVVSTVAAVVAPVLDVVSTIASSIPTSAPVATCASTDSVTTENVRIVQDENLLDQLLSGTEDDLLFEMPEALRSPPCSIPKPSLPDISLPVVEEPPVSSSSSSTDHSVLIETVNKLANRVCGHLNNIEKQLQKNHDQMEKIEIAIRRGYSNNVTPRYSNFMNRSSNFRQPFNNYRSSYRNNYRAPRSSHQQSPRKRKFVPEKSLSPVKKVKSAIRKKDKA